MQQVQPHQLKVTPHILCCLQTAINIHNMIYDIYNEPSFVDILGESHFPAILFHIGPASSANLVPLAHICISLKKNHANPMHDLHIPVHGICRWPFSSLALFCTSKMEMHGRQRNGGQIWHRFRGVWYGF